MTNKCRYGNHPIDARTLRAGGEVCFDCATATHSCTTCGAPITEVQAKISQLRADGALPRCKDCITAELTRQLISDAAQAVEEIDPDELERYAAERKVPDGR